MKAICKKEFIMKTGEVAFSKGKTYDFNISDYDKTISAYEDNEGSWHELSEWHFARYFRKVNK